MTVPSHHNQIGFIVCCRRHNFCTRLATASDKLIIDQTALRETWLHLLDPLSVGRGVLLDRHDYHLRRQSALQKRSPGQGTLCRFAFIVRQQYPLYRPRLLTTHQYRGLHLMSDRSEVLSERIESRRMIMASSP